MTDQTLDQPGSMDPFANISLPARISALEQRISAIENAVSSGNSTPSNSALTAKLQHVMDKYFPHDNPEPEPRLIGAMGYNPFTGAPVVEQLSDGTDRDANGHRWPREKTNMQHGMSQ